jgi:hypothetical protein
MDVDVYDSLIDNNRTAISSSLKSASLEKKGHACLIAPIQTQGISIVNCY